MYQLRLTLMFLLLSTSAFADDLKKEVEYLKLRVGDLEATVTAQRSKINRMENLQEEHEVLLKKLVTQLYDLKDKLEKRGNQRTGTTTGSPY